MALLDFVFFANPAKNQKRADTNEQREAVAFKFSKVPFGMQKIYYFEKNAKSDIIKKGTANRSLIKIDVLFEDRGISR
ncbi:hypothetical protein [Actinobacillus delphinicola]|uniref:hypothetical protein n=1 Tax=Actinobacillus delphinicola TaxID=51161 RepID=UPI002442FA98|nr:hypothetical protein [Actinobacillus delphinicola]